MSVLVNNEKNLDIYIIPYINCELVVYLQVFGF